MLRFSYEVDGLREAMSAYSGENIAKGVKRGFSRIGDGVKTVASASIRERFNIKKSDLDRKFEVRATADQVLITCTSRSVNLTYFGAMQLGSIKGKRLTIKRKKDEIKRTIRGKAGAFSGVSVPIEASHTTLLPKAFIARVKAGNKGGFNIGVFQRANYAAKNQAPRVRPRKTSRPYVMKNRAITKPRQAIINMATMSPSRMFGSDRVQAIVQNYLNDSGVRIMQHEIEFALGLIK